MNGPIAAERRNLILLLLVGIVLWFGSLDYRHLVQPDEGRYAEIPREMVASGDWLTPRLNDLKYFEKPALQYWVTASGYKLLGEHEWVARLWPALTGFAGILLVFFAGNRLFGAPAGFYAALVLASNVLYVAIAHINTLDMGVTFFMALGMAGFMLAQAGSSSPWQSKAWMHVAWAALALAVLSKGLMGAVLPGAVLVIYSVLQRDWTVWRKLHFKTGAMLFLVISAPWLVAVSLANPEFFRFFFIYEHFERFLYKAHGRYQPWWYFVPILFLGMLPWVFVMLDALPRAWKSVPPDNKGFHPQRFLVVWAVLIFVFFSLSNSKLPSYILPIFPALALLTGKRLSETSGGALFWRLLPVALLAAAGVGLAPWVANMASEVAPQALYAEYAKWALAAAAVWLIGTLTSLYLTQLESIRRGLVTLALSGLVAVLLVLNGHESLAPSNSSYHIARQIKPYLKPGIPFYSIGMYDQTLPFYLKRTFTLVGYQGELAFGIAQEPRKYLPDVAAFKRAWSVQPYALAIMPPDVYQKIEREGLPMQLIARDTRRVVVKTP